MREDNASERSPRKSSYRYIDPLLDCRGEEARKEIRPFRSELQQLAGKLSDGRAVTHISAYFRDLQNGTWFGINEQNEFLPASLLKVPLMMAVYHKNEEAGGLLAETLKVPVTFPVATTQKFSPGSTLVVGSTYTVEALVSAVVRHSDNAAMWALVLRFGGAGMQEIYDELAITTPDEGVPDVLRVKDYASLFRLLYNSSYLGRPASERALGELARTDFHVGIVAPLPKEMVVAHKYGERDLPTGEKQLHDCGIIYYPEHPYILCVMTRGHEWRELSLAIQAVSELAYRKVRVQFPLK